MLNANSYKIIESQIEKINFPEFINYRLKDNKTNTYQIELKLGKAIGFFRRAFNKYNPEVSLLVTMSIELQYNLFEPFLGLLPEHIRQTRKEKQLQEEIANLKKELESMTTQRDLLVKVASRG